MITLTGLSIPALLAGNLIVETVLGNLLADITLTVADPQLRMTSPRH